MRVRFTAVVLGALAAVGSGAGADRAAAQKQRRRQPSVPIAGQYHVKFESVGNSCRDTGVDLDRGKVKIKKRKGVNRISVHIPLMQMLQGVKRPGGKFRAEAKRGPSMIAGLDVRSTVAGRAIKGDIRMVLVAEYYRGRKPYCTQSWNVASVPKKR